MAGYSEDFPGYGAGELRSALDEREKTLRKLSPFKPVFRNSVRKDLV